MRTITSLVLVALTAACAVGPGYHRPSLGMPDGWRPSSASEDSLRPFYDSLRTSRDTLLPHGADPARVPFAYDTAPAGARGDPAAAPTWPRVTSTCGKPTAISRSPAARSPRGGSRWRSPSSGSIRV